MRQVDLEQLPLHDSKGKRRQYGWNGRDNRGPKCGPLIKWLQSWEGEPWDDVWKAANLKFDREELKVVDYLVTKDFIGFDKLGNPLDGTGHWIHRHFYTNGGVLRKVPPTRFKGREPPKEIYYISVNNQMYGKRTDGLWYRLYFKDVPEPIWKWKEEVYYKNHTMWIKRNVAEVVFDVWLQEKIYYPERSPWKQPIYCFKYEQCNKKDLRVIKRFLAEQMVKQ